MQNDPLPPLRPPTPLPRPYARRTVWLVVLAVGVIMGLWLLGTPPGVHGKADAVGYAICHRITERSFQIAGRPLPLCARCTGIYLGVMTGFAILLISDRRSASDFPPRRVLALLGVFVVLMGLDGVNSFLTLFPGYPAPYQPQNWLRLITGSLAGLTMINVIYPIFNLSLWRRPNPARTLRSLREFGGVLLVVLLVDAIVLLGNSTALFVLGLISAAGPVVVLTMVWTILFVSMTRRENSAHTWRDLVVPVLAGVAITFVMIGGIDAARFAWTSTWDGFDFSALRGGS